MSSRVCEFGDARLSSGTVRGQYASEEPCVLPLPLAIPYPACRYPTDRVSDPFLTACTQFSPQWATEKSLSAVSISQIPFDYSVRGYAAPLSPLTNKKEN